MYRFKIYDRYVAAPQDTVETYSIKPFQKCYEGERIHRKGFGATRIQHARSPHMKLRSTFRNVSSLKLNEVKMTGTMTYPIPRLDRVHEKTLYRSRVRTFLPLSLRPRQIVLVALILLIGTSSGCTFFSRPATEEKLDANQAYWFHYEAARRGGFLVGADSKIKMCAEPAPDVALARTVELMGKGAYQGASAEAQAKLAEKLAQLGGRTETVLILRESLFRLCELSINNPALPPAELKGLYKDVIDAVVQLATADVTNAQAEEKKAKAELENAKTLQMRTFESLNPEIRKQMLPP